ncbi:MAG TPA: hypothetical protein VGJ45_05550, partial [Pseudonocardiaceae bacterium]
MPKIAPIAAMATNISPNGPNCNRPEPCCRATSGPFCRSANGTVAAPSNATVTTTATPDPSGVSNPTRAGPTTKLVSSA